MRIRLVSNMPNCECNGAGYEELSTEDLIMLRNIMKRQTNDVAKGTLLAIRKELEARA